MDNPRNIYRKLALLLVALCFPIASTWAIFPMYLQNNSQFADQQIYIAILGKRPNGLYMYYDFSKNSASQVNFLSLSESINTLHKNANDWGYADIFTTLDQIPNKTIYIDQSYSCRLLIGFGSPMYLHAFGNGYAGADLANPADPNANVRWENMEFTYDEYDVMFINTTRVDAFQYPMGVELYGNVAAGANNALMKRGELLSYGEIINRWQSEMNETTYLKCMANRIKSDTLGPVIIQPSKVASIKDAGIFDNYIDAIWSTFSQKTLLADMGNLGIWSGRVSGEVFTLTNTVSGAVAKITAKPTTNNAIEGAGVFAAGSEVDKAVQAMFCGAINRGMVDLNKKDNELQYWGDRSRFFTANTYNQYVAFFHNEEISHDGFSYAFCYDDTFDQSATCATSHPDHVNVLIGGFTNNPHQAVIPIEPTNPTTPNGTGGTGTTEQGLQYTYTIEQVGTDVTFRFNVVNSDDFVGLVPVIWDGTKGFMEHINQSSYTFHYPVGTTIRCACKWMFAGGDSHTPYIEYVVKDPNHTALNPNAKKTSTTKILYNGQLRIVRDGHTYSIIGQRY